jgi:hypothetical protein
MPSRRARTRALLRRGRQIDGLGAVGRLTARSPVRIVIAFQGPTVNPRPARSAELRRRSLRTRLFAAAVILVYVNAECGVLATVSRRIAVRDGVAGDCTNPSCCCGPACSGATCCVQDTEAVSRSRGSAPQGSELWSCASDHGSSPRSMTSSKWSPHFLPPISLLPPSIDVTQLHGASPRLPRSSIVDPPEKVPRPRAVV